MLKELNFSDYSYREMQKWLTEHHYKFDAEMMEWVVHEEDYYCICIWDEVDFYVLYYGRDGKLNRANIEN